MKTVPNLNDNISKEGTFLCYNNRIMAKEKLRYKQ